MIDRPQVSEVADSAAQRTIQGVLRSTWASPLGVAHRFYRTSPPGAAAAALLIALVLVAIFANQLAPNDPLDTSAPHFQKPPWWLVVYPGVTITVAILAFNLFGDGLRDHLDPKLRERGE